MSVGLVNQTTYLFRYKNFLWFKR